MKLSKNALQILKKLEGFRKNVYLDSANIPTIGYGFTYYTNGNKVTLQDPPISEEKAEKLLLNILKSFENNVNKRVKQRLSQNQFDALVLFSYNVGNQAFTDSTLLKVINKDVYNYDEIEYQFKRWNKANGLILNGLVKRRITEFNIYKHEE